MKTTHANKERTSSVGAIRLSVVIPLHNGLPYFERTIDSILQQSYDLSKVEVLIVDNGSTDGSGAYVDRIADEYPSLFRVWHQQDSGGPSSPRNRGIEHAQGDYVFLCDADDYFGIEAFERMVHHADEWNSDLLLVKVVGLHGRIVPKSMFHIDQPKADVWSSRVFNSLGPWKLYRRSLIGEKRFSESFCVREDELFVAHCMFEAKTISVASDYPYYYVEQREDAANLTARAFADFDDRFKVFVGLLDSIKTEDSYSVKKAEKYVFPQVIRSSWLSCLAAIMQSDASREEKSVQLERLHRESSEILSDNAIEGLPPALQAVCISFRDHDDSFAFGVLSQIELTHNGSYLGHSIDEKHCSVGKDGTVEWKVEADERSRDIDITNHIPFAYRIDEVDVGDDSIDFSGSYETNQFWIAEESEVKLIIDRDGKDDISAIPCAVDGIEEGRVHWRAKVMFDLLESLLPEEATQVHFSIGIARDAYSRVVRFGAKSENEGARSALFGWTRPTKNKTNMLVPKSSLMGNLIIKSVRIPLDYEITHYDVSQQRITLCGTVALADCWNGSTRLVIIVRNRQTTAAKTMPVDTRIVGDKMEWNVDLLQMVGHRHLTALLRAGEDIDFFIMAVSENAERKKRLGSEFPESLAARIDNLEVSAGILTGVRLRAYFTDKGNLSMGIVR